MPPGTAPNAPVSRRLARIRAWLRGHPAAVTLAGTFSWRPDWRASRKPFLMSGFSTPSFSARSPRVNSSWPSP